jgi:hypothetical protein
MGAFDFGDVDSGTLRLALKKGHKPWLKSVSFSPDGKTLVRQAKLGASCRVKVPVGEGS